MIVEAINVLIVFGVVITVVIAGALGLCAYVMRESAIRTGATIDTLDQLFRTTNDRCMDACDFHLQARRDEWDGRNAATRPDAPRAPEVETVPEGTPMDWSAVRATENGRV